MNIVLDVTQITLKAMLKTVMYITYKSSVCCVLNFNKTFQWLAIDFPGLYQRVTQALVQHVHTTKLEKTPALSQAKTADNTSESVAGMESKEISKKATPNLFTYMNPAKITEQQRIKIEWLMFRMFICCALPWTTSFHRICSCTGSKLLHPRPVSFFP